MYCNQKIITSEETGKWLPYNKDGSAHDCRTTATTETIDTTGQKGQKEPTIEQLKIWIARLEKNGIHIDINSIMNVKPEKKE